MEVAGCNYPAVTMPALRMLSEAAAAGGSHSLTAGAIVLIIGAALLGGGIVITAGGLGHRLDYKPQLKRPFAMAGLWMLGVGAVLLLIGLLTK